MSTDVAYIESLMGIHPDFPKKGINFIDFLPILRNPKAFEMLLTHITNHIYTSTLPKTIAAGEERKVDVVVGLDARGFLLGPTLALRLGAAFVPVRKAGKLPGDCVKVEYALEYGSDAFELQKDAIKPGQTVIVIDDLIATGGSASAAGALVKQCGGKVIEYIFVVGIPFLKGADKLDAPSYWMINAD